MTSEKQKNTVDGNAFKINFPPKKKKKPKNKKIKTVYLDYQQFRPLHVAFPLQLSSPSHHGTPRLRLFWNFVSFEAFQDRLPPENNTIREQMNIDKR